jgi:thiol-disulfide isomerase/thioredoxin
VLIGAEQLAIAGFNPFAGINPEAERIVAEVDRLPDAVIDRKIDAHERLYGRYDYADIDDGLRDHAQKIMALAQRALRTNALPMVPAREARNGTPARAAFSSAYVAMSVAYEGLARAAGDFLHADSALAILDEADRVVSSVFPDAHRGFESQRDMYRLVGTKATPIDGKWWINAPDGSVYDPGNGKVTVIQFTAHWCVPCRNSYPGFLRMGTRFAGKSFESVMVTDLYGYIGDKSNLTPEQEVAEDRDYYAKHHKLPFKIAISPTRPRGDSGPPDNNMRYAVGGIPQIIVVDRKGTIRATVVGWDQGNEQRLGALVERLLAEK